MELMALMLYLLSFLDILRIWGFRFYAHFFPFHLQKFISAKWDQYWSNTPTKMNGYAGSKANLIEEGCPLLLQEEDHEEICMEDVNIVMSRLGIGCEEQIASSGGVEVGEFTQLFLQAEPSLAEIKQVFEVFDVNGDGFIDATELQRVLCGLSIREGSELAECGKMISAFDANGDGLLDFQEFVLVMENSFC